MFIAVCYVVSLLVGVVAAVTGGGSLAEGSAEALRWVLLLGVGVPLLVAFVGHAFGGQSAARRLGWPEGNPFQTKLGIWDGAGGLIAIIAFWQHGGFWLATVTAHAFFWTGAGVVHVRELVRARNLRADNLLPAFVDFLVPITIVTLFVLTEQ